MRWLDIIRGTQKNDSAKKAKDRLQLIVTRSGNSTQDGSIQKMEQELLEVVRKYYPVEQDQVRVNLDNDGDLEVLELNITLSEHN